MKPKIVHCLSRQVIDAQDGWSYSLKEYVGDAVILKYGLAIMKHRVPWFLSLHAHLRMEKTLEDFAHLIFPQFAFKTLLLPYDIIHGIICGYNMREMLDYWRSRT